jgi:hypothetical protein
LAAAGLGEEDGDDGEDDGEYDEGESPDGEAFHHYSCHLTISQMMLGKANLANTKKMRRKMTTRRSKRRLNVQGKLGVEK